MSRTVVEFKKGPKGPQEPPSGQDMVEEHFSELIDVVVRLRGCLDYYEPEKLIKSHAGDCTGDTVCDAVCEQAATMNLANSLLNRLDSVLGKLNLVE